MQKKQNSPPNNFAVGYTRFSSVNQKEESTLAQQRAITEFAERKGLQLVKFYDDIAKTGTNADREAFQEMLADAQEKKFKYLIIHKIDRFARDRYDSVVNKRKLKMNGVTVLSVIENLDGSPESKILESVLEGMAEYYSDNLAREVMKGKKEKAYDAKHLGGFPPLGYDVEPVTRKYIVNEAEAVIVRLIFSKYAEGVGYNKILEYLNSMDYHSKQGRPFGKNSLLSILRNEKYIGKYIFNKKLEKDVSGKRNPCIKPEEEWIVVPGGVPAIISEEMFNTVQVKLADNKKKAGQFRAKEVYLLSGLVECAECGGNMYGNTRMCGRNKSNYSSYRCSGRANHQGCKNKEVRRDYIDNYVLDELYRRLFSDLSIKKLAARLNEYNQKKSGDSSLELKKAQEELKEVTSQISDIVKLVTISKAPPETVSNDFYKLGERKQLIEGYLHELELKNKETLLSEETVLELLSRSRDFIRAHNIPECRNFINTYVEKVLVSSDKVEVFFKIHVPDEALDKVIPLKSEEGLLVLRKEYQDVPKGWGSQEEALVGQSAEI